ncbi:MAG: ribulokinase [Phaeodactylibacter sp.]|nr:ribulokinase [Phaeodactylibacter sp.]MCB9263502.1 ribulokinase [Lewinellaceae bacterium]MCB9287620.1 ribulokinase [Lewinellaceae bacterium]
MNNYVIGIDYGTDSVRSVIINTDNGEEAGSAVFYYPRWKKGLYCDPAKNQFRQHPLDYLEGLETSVKEALKMAPAGIAANIRGIAVDTTGSTPVAVDKNGAPLSLKPGFEEEPDAMFILWKDHTALREAAEINELAAKWEVDYTKYEGGIYSSEWFWAKILRTLRVNENIRQPAYSWVEHCDWIPFLLTGGSGLHQMKRSRCAAGHKALWHEDFGGLPPNAFFTALDPLLDGLVDRLYRETFTSDVPAGNLSEEWAQRLGLSTEVVVSVGAFDAHMGAVGGQIEPYHLSKVMGTSTCDMLVAPMDGGPEKLVSGICGQVDGSVIPGMLGLEAGQSAFGDVYAWFRNLLAWTLDEVVGKSQLLDGELKQKLIDEASGRIIPELTAAAEKIPPGDTGIIALDWLNGRRTPDANQALKGAIFGLNLGSDAPKVFRALVEATCFGARKIVDRFQEEGVPIKGVIGLGGVARKSPFVMQTMADVLNQPIKIARSEQTCALGAAMFAATAAGIYDDVSRAMSRMGSGFDAEYHPDPKRAALYEKIYQEYNEVGAFAESFFGK